VYAVFVGATKPVVSAVGLTEPLSVVNGVGVVSSASNDWSDCYVKCKTEFGGLDNSSELDKCLKECELVSSSSSNSTKSVVAVGKVAVVKPVPVVVGSGKNNNTDSVHAVRCVASDDYLKEYTALIEKYELAGNEEEKEKILESIKDLKEKISRNKCSVLTSSSSVTGVQKVEPGVVSVKPSLVAVDSCSELSDWNKKIEYYEGLLELSESELKKKGFSYKEVKKVLEELYNGRDRVKAACSGTVSGSSGVEEPVEAFPVHSPVVVSSASEVSSYYRQSVSDALNYDSVDDQIKALKEIQLEIDKLIARLLKEKEKIEFDELKEFGREIRVKPKVIEVGSQRVEAEKQIEARVGNDTVTVSTSEQGVELKTNNQEVKVMKELVVSEEGLKLNDKVVKVSPNVISTALPELKEVELDEQNNKPVYKAKVKNVRNLFFVLPIETEETVVVDAGSGVVESYEAPWWSFLGSGSNVVEEGAVLQ